VLLTKKYKRVRVNGSLVPEKFAEYILNIQVTTPIINRFKYDK